MAQNRFKCLGYLSVQRHEKTVKTLFVQFEIPTDKHATLGNKQ